MFSLATFSSEADNVGPLIYCVSLRNAGAVRKWTCPVILTDYQRNCCFLECRTVWTLCHYSLVLALHYGIPYPRPVSISVAGLFETTECNESCTMSALLISYSACCTCIFVCWESDFGLLIYVSASFTRAPLSLSHHHSIWQSRYTCAAFGYSELWSLLSCHIMLLLWACWHQLYHLLHRSWRVTRKQEARHQVGLGETRAA